MALLRVKTYHFTQEQAEMFKECKKLNRKENKIPEEVNIDDTAQMTRILKSYLRLI